MDLNDLLVISWRKYEQTKDIEYLHTGMRMTREAADKLDIDLLRANSDLLLTNMAHFSPIHGKMSAKIGQVIGFFVKSELNPSKIYTGQCGAGSELAVNEMANALSRKGFSVYIFSDINTKTEVRYCLSGRNPQYMPISKSKEEEYIAPSMPGWVGSFDSLLLSHAGKYSLDHLIVWRTPKVEGYKFQNYAPKVSFWSHDMAVQRSLSFSFTPHVVYALTDWHISNLRSRYGNLNYIKGCNGTGVDLSIPIKRRHGKTVGWYSNWARGLNNLLEIWPDVLREVPDAKLRVGYGRQTWGLLEEKEIDKLEMKIKEMNVTMLGMLPYQRMLEELEKESVIAYCCHDHPGETFSIVMVACQQLGCIPLVRRVEGMKETVSAQDGDLLNIDEYKNKLISILKTDEDELYPLRDKYREATKHYTWDEAANTWSLYI